MKSALTDDFDKGCIQLIYYSETGVFSHGGEVLDFHHIFNIYPSDKGQYDELFLSIIKALPHDSKAHS